MSPKLPVPLLGNLCIRYISSQLIQILSSDEETHEEIMREYLSNVTHEVLQELLKDILNNIDLDAGTRFNSLSILLRNDVRKLETGIFPHSYYEQILNVIIDQGKGLQQLNLKGVWARDHPDLICILINSLVNLRILIIPHIANDDILQSISQCKHLNVLDISGESFYTPQGLSCLKNENLQILNIGYNGKKEVCDECEDSCDLILTLIQNLDNLKSIRTYSFTGASILSVYQSGVHSILKLTYLHDIGTTNLIFDAITVSCPYLESIHLDTPEKGVILKLKNLKKLNSLKIAKPYKEELIQYLLQSGSNIEVLKVVHNRTNSLDLSDIAVGSPRVHTLEFYQINLSFSKKDIYFMNLTNVEILYCDISNNTLKLLLTNSPLLKRLLVGAVITFTDDDIFQLCADCDFEFLEEFWLSYARNLTLMSVQILMEHCALLKIIGQIDNWDITNEEAQVFRSVLYESNVDLTLFPLIF